MRMERFSRSYCPGEKKKPILSGERTGLVNKYPLLFLFVFDYFRQRRNVLLGARITLILVDPSKRIRVDRICRYRPQNVVRAHGVMIAVPGGDALVIKVRGFHDPVIEEIIL